VLKNISQSKMPATVVINAHYTAEIDPELCTACGTCRETRCQVGAIEAADGAQKRRVLTAPMRVAQGRER
jgi:NAD-dependent dihydropyrimidine dehydrogenase PreA subunit